MFFTAKIKIPVLMYHEVIENQISPPSAHQMTPIYQMPVDKFESQIKLLFDRGYKSITFKDIPHINPNGKYIILTFDDGWAGNYTYVMPILKKYDFRAVIFVAVESIGKSGFLKWAEIIELHQNGFSIQSHTLTHRPLQTIDSDSVRHELLESKRLIEEKINNKVFSISFPHGSYNKKIIDIAQELGYEIMCHSNLVCIYNTNFSQSPAIVGRITMTSEINLNKFNKLIDYDQKEILKEKLTKGTKNSFKKIIGIENYRKLYRRYYNIAD